MSSGQFTRSKYELDGGATIVPISLQPETLAFSFGGNTNDAPAGAVNLEVSAYARKPANRYGIGARRVTISWEGNPPTGYKDENLTVPILTETLFDGITLNGAANYLGTACVVVSKAREDLD